MISSAPGKERRLPGSLPINAPGDVEKADDGPESDRKGDRNRVPLAGILHATVSRETEGAQAILWLPVAMALGAAFWFGLDNTPPFAILAVLSVLNLIGLIFLDRGCLHFVALIAAGFLVGMLAAQLETQLEATVLLDGEVTTRIKGRVVDRDIDHAGRWRYTINVHGTSEPEIRRPPERVRLVSRSKKPPVEIGDGISGLARLRPPSGPALPGEYDFTFHAYFQGIGANGFFYGAPEMAEIAGQGVGQSYLQGARQDLARLREAISARIRAVLSGDAGSLASALTVAERRSIRPDIVEALRASGLAHILAISGLHMALVAGTFFYFVRACFSLFPSLVQALPVKKIAAGGALAIATVYLVISGASVSTQRAFIMLAIMLFAVMLDRRALTMRNVALAAILIVLFTPSAVVGPGFQMSFAATAALIATYTLWDRRRPEMILTNKVPVTGFFFGVIMFFFGLAVTSLVAGMATAPFAIFHFHRIAPFGVLANLAAMPIVTFVVMPAGLFSLLAMPIGLEYWPLVVMGKGLDAVIAIARYVEDLGGALVIGRISVWLLAVMVAGFLICVLMRTRLRLAGFALMGAAGIVIATGSPGPAPHLLVSEDGRLVAAVSGKSLATNRKRPPKFIFEQWQRSLGGTIHVGPENIVGTTTGSDGRLSLPRALKQLEGSNSNFRCLEDSFCVAILAGGKRIVVVEDLAVIGAACDHADLVVTARRIAMQRCYSGAMLVTGRMLRKSGSLEIRFDESGSPVIHSAIAGTDRPWTRHRFYNWRSGSFEAALPAWIPGER